MEILWWLAPAVVVTLVAMLWVGWVGRSRDQEVDRDAAARRLGEALERGARRPGYAAAPRRPERSTGVAVRRPSATSAAEAPPAEPAPRRAPAPPPAAEHGDGEERRAS